MSGYGIEMDNLLPLLREEYKRKYIDDYIEIEYIFKSLFQKYNEIKWFVSDDGEFLYIPDSKPYTSIFKDKETINEYFYNALKDYLKEESKNLLTEKLSDMFSCEIY